ncbi:uncharacterized protein MICPUCDRAFT_5503, partial [Micromonas pusilla CCMP1545]
PRAPSQSKTLFVTVEPDASDDWRLDEIADVIRGGGVGIIPTDTKYAFVADLESRDAVQTLYRLKDAGVGKPMSVLVRGFSDIDAYTQGFPDNVVAGRTQPFKLARQCLPGPYTFILQAGKAMPKICLQDPSTKSKSCKARKTVGVRFSADPVCRALLSRLDRPLLASTVPCEVDGDGIEYAQDPAVMCDDYESEGLLAFVIDCGVRENPPSTVIDLSGGAAKLLRRGAGDASAWVEDDEEETLAD